MENRMADLAELFRLLAARGIEANSREMKLITKLLDNEYDFGYRAAERKHGIPTQRSYGTGHAKP